MLNFDFLEKGLGIVSTVRSENNFLRKMFFMLYSIGKSKLSTPKSQ